MGSADEVNITTAELNRTMRVSALYLLRDSFRDKNFQAI